MERIRSVPRGFVCTYGDIEPRAPRLTGRVLATTREKVPWPRVARSNGEPAMGARQLELLRREGVPLRAGRVDLRQARYMRGGWS